MRPSHSNLPKRAPLARSMTVAHSAHPRLHKPPSNAICLSQRIHKQTRGAVWRAIKVMAEPSASEKEHRHVDAGSRIQFALRSFLLPWALEAERRLKEAVILLCYACAWHGGRSCVRVRNSCFAQRSSAQASRLHLVCVVPSAFFGLAGQCGGLSYSYSRWVVLIQIGRTSHCAHQRDVLHGICGTA